ncbi:uncharacterized protein LOC123694574 [Colias croceus]|uniref:uncharacterized protein LOC123694574 n=1 Tax=Colias crocea TaxID=72248 RepID=UPI001E27B814|nr:uncharacterized protein LOC123694574 [Colias croceus]
MIRTSLRILKFLSHDFQLSQYRYCHNVFGIKDLLQPEKHEPLTIKQIRSDDHNAVIDIIKEYYLTEHVFVQTRNMDLKEDRAIDEYIAMLLKQGNSIYARAKDGSIAGLCVNFASSPVDPKNLRNYAFYRQDPNTKDFLYFIAKLQETPNLWNIYKQPKIFEIKMLAVLPEYRRQGVAVMLAEKSKEQAQDQGYNVIRMDCINQYDFKIAERCMMSCLVKFPLHKLRGPNAPFIKRSSDHNRCVRVYVHARIHTDRDKEIRGRDFENLLE